MTLWLIRSFFVALIALVGYQIGVVTSLGTGTMGALWGVAFAVRLIVLEMGLRKISSRGLSATVFGLLLGLIMARVVISTFDIVPVK